MRIVSWNMQHGGGRRVAGLVERLAMLQPDICVLVEYQLGPSSRAVRAALAGQGLAHTLTSLPETASGRENGLLIASRWPLTPLPIILEGAPAVRWVPARVEADVPLMVGAVHVPNRGEMRDSKYAYLSSLVALARGGGEAPAILLGDYNTGRRGFDETGPFFNATEDRFMVAMSEAGWADAFRHLHGDERRYSWWLRRGEKRSGFRLDHAFISPALLPRLAGCDLVHDEQGWPSDHAALVVDLRDQHQHQEQS